MRKKVDLVFSGTADEIQRVKRSFVVRALKSARNRKQNTTDIHEHGDDAHATHRYSTQTASTILKLRSANAKIEAHFAISDVTAFEDGKQRQTGQFARLILTTKSSSAFELFKIARLLQEESNYKLRLEAKSLSECTIDSIDPLFCTQKILAPANRIEINANGTAHEARKAALVYCAHRVAQLAPLISGNRNPQAVKQLRVALRRFRTIERCFRMAGKDRELSALANRARKFARILGHARDWAVFAEETLPGLALIYPRPEGIAALQTGAARHRDLAWQNTVKTVNSPDFMRFCLDLYAAAWTPVARSKKGRRKSEMPARDFAEMILNHRRARTLDLANGLDRKHPAAGHPLRLQLKKLRYSAQLFRDIYPKETRKPYFSTLSALQDSFGALNDAVIAETLASHAAAGQGKAAIRAAGFVSGYVSTQANAHARPIFENLAAFSKMPAYWRRKY